MPAYAVRGDYPVFAEVPRTPASEYKRLSTEQFIQFARVYLKDKIMSLSCIGALAPIDKQRMNDFFERIPNYLVDFSSEVSIKLLMMHITTNIEYGFGCRLNESETDNLFWYLDRLRQIDPRLSK